ncbi:threonine---tRNA ligase [Synchytrium microbalum]|uniref:threonine--tRNA ligase n=1 Tax=Synchytrium microbalum TaxID=1806994 RepID=A0A507CE67_9FUNG|nr:threonine---tRNA ligase [Synchytrium microbalum]TPX36336.1 threonine---tRNA ligase [Synchytrium microbalum]
MRQSVVLRRCAGCWKVRPSLETHGLPRDLIRWASTYASHRIRVWNECEKKQSTLPDAQEPINITLPDGRVHVGIKDVTTPRQVFRPERTVNAVFAKIDSKISDIDATISTNCHVSLVKPDVKTPDALMGIWHSGAHLLGAAIEQEFGDDALLADGPALKSGGFYYDALLRSKGTLRIEHRLKDWQDGAIPSLERVEDDIRQLMRPDPANGEIFAVTEADVEKISRLMASIAERKTAFTRLAISRKDAFRMFAYSPLKLYFLYQIPPQESVTVYKLGDFIDLCRGPHVQHAGQLSAFRLISSSAARWDAQDTSSSIQPLTRVTGIAFPQAKALEEWELNQAEMKKRDHRVVGRAQSLFMHHPLAPGSAFLLPHGARIARRMIDYIRSEYRVCGFSEVVTPLLYHKELWETSGHWDNYREDMFMVGGVNDMESRLVKNNSESEDEHHHHHHSQPEIHGLKPMNCPGHCLLFHTSAHSYRDLPIRLAEFSPLHRNEVSGALTGLTRVRQFHQDDAHIFCTPDQILSEIESTLALIHRTYTRLGFTSYELALSTRPTNFIGDIAQWDAAEIALRKALDNTGREWTVSPGNGAFYGPKIDITLQDALGRTHQTGTVQLDFQLPQRFDLKYQDIDGTIKTPVIVHRAVIGSVERMLAVLTEHHGGKWPFWLSPRQAIVLPVKADDIDYAEQVRDAISQPDRASSDASYWHRYYYIDVDKTDNLLAKKVLLAQSSQFNFALVVGKKERLAQAVRVRKRGGEDLGMMTVDQVLAMFRELESTFK